LIVEATDVLGPAELVDTLQYSGAVMTTLHERSEPGVTTINRSHPLPTGTWTIDPADSSISFAWRTLRLWTSTARLHGLGVIHLDELPSVGVIRFQQPSGLPVLTMALDPASVETGDAELDAMLRGPDVVDVMGPRWWTLHSESLEVLPNGTWRVMATLTDNGTAGLVELHLEVDTLASRRDWLVMRGRGCWIDGPSALASGPRSSTPRSNWTWQCTPHQWKPAPALRGMRDIHNQHAGLSELLTAQRRRSRTSSPGAGPARHAPERPIPPGGVAEHHDGGFRVWRLATRADRWRSGATVGRELATIGDVVEHRPSEARSTPEQRHRSWLLRKHPREQLAHHAVREVALELAADITQHAIALIAGLRAAVASSTSSRSSAGPQPASISPRHRAAARPSRMASSSRSRWSSAIMAAAPATA